MTQLVLAALWRWWLGVAVGFGILKLGLSLWGLGYAGEGGIRRRGCVGEGWEWCCEALFCLGARGELGRRPAQPGPNLCPPPGADSARALSPPLPPRPLPAARPLSPLPPPP